MQRRPATNIVPRTRLKGAVVSILTLALLAGFNAAHAETLRDALATAYLYNPTLKAARAQLRATDEEVARAKSGFRPTITGDIQHSFQDVKSSPSLGTDGDSYPRSYSVTLNQPIFRGFRTINGIRGAEALVEAGREDLRAQRRGLLRDEQLRREGRLLDVDRAQLPAGKVRRGEVRVRRAVGDPGRQG